MYIFFSFSVCFNIPCSLTRCQLGDFEIETSKIQLGLLLPSHPQEKFWVCLCLSPTNYNNYHELRNRIVVHNSIFFQLFNIQYNMFQPAWPSSYNTFRKVNCNSSLPQSVLWFVIPDDGHAGWNMFYWILNNWKKNWVVIRGSVS
jgi:hypothetical protein